MSTTKKSNDITKTGPMSYRQLQDANIEQLEGVRPEFQSMLDNLYRRYPTVSAHDASVQSEGLVSSGLSDTDTPWGASMFDENAANEEQFRRLGDTRAENEPWFAKLGAGVAKGAVLAGTTFLNGTLGLAAGIGTAAAEGRWSGIWDNDFSNAMNEINEWSEKVMPNYYTEAEQNRPWYKNLGTANFWGDKFIKNLGFTIGAYYSGGVYSKGMGALMEALHAGTKATSMVTSGLGAVISAVNEGSMEGLNGMNEYEQKYRPVLDAQYQERVNMIKAEYEANKGKRLVPTGTENADYVDPAYVRYINEMETARANYESALGRLEQDKAKVGNMILAMNIPILTASNLFQFGKLYSRGYNTARRTQGIIGNPGEYTAKGTGKLTTVGKILGGGLAEGKEEVEQQIATDVSEHYYASDVNNYYRSLHDPKASEDTLNWFKTFGETMVQTLGEGSTWEQFFIGGLTGILGMPRFRGIRNEQGKLQSPVVLEENAISKWKDLRKQAEADKAIADRLNERVNSPEFRSYYQGLVRHNKYQNDMNDAAWRGDEFDYKNAEHAQLMSDISVFYNAGKLDDLKTLIGSAYDLSDENLESIVKNTTSTVEKDGKNVKVGPFIDEKGNPVDKETMKGKLTQQRDEILNTIDNYVKTRNYIDNYTMGRLTDDQLDELVLLRTQRDNWLERSAEMSGQVRSSLKNVIGKLNQYIHALEGVMYEEGKNNKGLTKEYNKADEMKRGLAKAVETLNTVVESDDAGMVGILSANPKFVNAIKETLDAIDDTVLDQDSKIEVKTKLDDILRIGKATDLYNNKIKEYYLHPDKQAEDHVRVDEETAEQYASAEEAETVNKLNTAVTFKDVTDVMNERKVTPANLDSSTSIPAKEYMKATMFKKKAEELINSSNSPRKSELLDMLNRRFDESDNYDDLSDPSLLTELPKTAVAMDSVQQDTLEHEFSEVIKAAADKIASGKSQKQSVNPEKTGTSTPPNAGKDDVEQPPVSTEDRSKIWFGKIDLKKIPADVHDDVRKLIARIADNTEELEKEYNPQLARDTKNLVNELSIITGNTAIADIIKKVKDVAATPVQDTSSQDDVLRENAAENVSHASTPVTGVLKAVVPQFDLDAKRDGKLIDFVGDGRNSGYTYVYGKLKEVNPTTGKSAFDYVNEGNVKEGDELEVRYEEATDEHPELLGLYHNGVLVNYMNTDESIPGVKEIKDKAKKGNKATVRVSKIMDGEFGYDRTKTQSIGDLLGANNAVIGVMKNRAMAANTDMYVEPVFDEANSDGRVYLLLPNSKGTLTPQRVYIRHFNSSEVDINDARNPIIAELRELFRQLTTLSDDGVDMEGRLDSLYGTLVGLLYVPDSFHINIVQNRNSVFLRVSFNDRDGNRVNRDVLLRKFAQKSLLTIGEGESQSEEGFTPDRTTLFNQIIGVFQEANLAFNIDANRLAGKNGNEYADKLKRSNVLATYLTGKRMQGTWFLLNEKPGNPHTNDSYRRAKALQDAKDGVRVTNNGKEYFVRNSIVYDKTGSQMYLSPDEERLVKDLAYIESAYGNSYYGVNQDNGRVLISDSDGVRGFDRNTRKYLNDTELDNLRATLEGRKNKAELTGMAVKALEDSQKLVLRLDDGRPDTSSGSYMIKEDDGQYHEYQRVHSVIGSNYIGPSTGDNATRRGSVVDEVSRQYLIDPEHTVKPAEMSDVAFSSLKKGLDQFKADTEKKGLKIITDRTVVFHKYDDGRRIAGELDVFAYNPYTGAVTIFDFKTSKYSTSDTSFSKVTNPNMFVRSNKDQYSRQLSAYSRLFTDSFGVPVSNLVIVPFQIRYGKEKGSISAVFPEKYVPLDYVSDVFSDSSVKPESHPTPSQSQMDQFNAIDALLGVPSPEPESVKVDNPVPPVPVSPEAKPVISDDIYSRKWDDMTDADKAYIRPVFPGMSDTDIQKFWDGLDENFRKEYVVSCL